MPDYNLGTARGKIDIDSRGLKEADISLREAGRGLLYTGGALVGAFGYVVKTAADFEKQMDFVQAITQGTAAEMDALKEVAIELGKQGPYGPREVSEAFVELAKAGVDTKDIIDGVGEASVNLAAAADIGLVESTEILVNTLKTFGLEAEDAIYVVDQIAGAANASTIDVDDFAYSLRYAGSIAAAIGVPLDEVSTALAILGDRGIKGSTGGTSLRRVLLNLQPASKNAAKVLEELGIITEDGANQFFTAEGKAKSLSEVFQILGDSMEGLTDAEKLNAINKIFGARAAPAALILAGQGAEGFEQYAAAIERTTAADVAAARLDNLAGSVTKLKAALEAVFIQSGTPFQESLKELVDIVRELVLAFGELPEPLQKFIVGGVGVLGVLSLLAGGFLLTVGNIVRAIRVMGQLGGLFGALGGGGAGGAAGAANSVGLLGRAFGFLISPIGLVVLAIAALVGAFIYFYKTNEEFREFINSIPGKIADAWNAVVDFFKGPFVDAMKTAWNAVKDFFGKIGDFFGKVGGEIGDFFGGIGSAIGGAASSGFDTLTDFFGTLGETLGNLGRGAFNGITDFFGSLGSTIGGGVTGALEALGDFFTNLPGMLADAGSAALEGFLGFMAQLPERLGYILGFAIGRVLRWHIELFQLIVQIGVDIVQGVFQWGVNILQTIINWNIQVYTQLLQWGGELLTWLGQLWLDMWMATIEFAQNMINTAIDLGGRFLLAFANFMMQLPGVMFEALTGVLGAIIGAIPGIVSAALDLGGQILGAIVDFVMQAPGAVLGFMLDVGGAIFGAIPGVAGFAIEMGEGILGGVIDAITGLPGLVWDIFQGVIGTIRDLVGDAVDAARDFGGGLWRGFKDGMGISSPSYIERALFAVEGQAFQTAANLSKAVRLINDKARSLPNLEATGDTAEKAGLTSIDGPATVGTGAKRLSGDGSDNTTIKAEITIENLHLGAGVGAQDAVRLSRILAEETKRQLEATTGKKLVTRGPQVAVL